MKKLIVLFIILTASIALAGDIHNNGRVYNGNINGTPASGDFIAYFEDYSHITYVYEFTFVDSSDAYHCKPIYIGNANASDGYIYAIQSATGDANILLHYSADDRNTWETITPADLDAVSSTAKTDTLGYNEAANDLVFHSARWLVVECIGGGTSNADDNVMTVVVRLNKETPTATKGNGDWVRMSRVANQSNTNP